MWERLAVLCDRRAPVPAAYLLSGKGRASEHVLIPPDISGGISAVLSGL